MKNMKLFSALLCSAVFFAGCSFTGTSNTFEKDIQEKYKNDEKVLSVNHNVLTVSMADFTVGDKDESDNPINYKAELTFNASLKDTALSGITMSVVSASGEKNVPYDLTDYPEYSKEFDKEDITNKTVILKVQSTTAPSDYIVKIDAASVESVTGQKLDKDDDYIWGEAEDSVYFTDSAYELDSGVFNSNGYFLTGRETYSLAPTGSVDDTTNELTVTAYIYSDNNKELVDSLVIVEKYDVYTDSWISVSSDSPSECTSGFWSKKYPAATYIPLRIKIKSLKDVTLENEAGVKLPFTTKQSLTFPSDYQYIDIISTLSPFYDGLLNPKTEDLSNYFTFTSVGKGVYDLSVKDTVLPSWKTDSSTECVTTEATGFEVAEGSVKVFMEGKADNSVTEIPVKVEVLDKVLRFTFEDKETKNLEGFTVVASKDAKVIFKGTINGTDEVFKLGLGHLCETSSSVTNNGYSKIYIGSQLKINVNIIGTKLKADKVGDIVFIDGSACPADEILTTTQIDNAVAIVFYAENNPDRLGNKILAVGIHLNNNNSYPWALSGTTGSNCRFEQIEVSYNSNIYSGDTYGGDNWTYICSVDPIGTANPAQYYPVFNEILEYPNKYNTGIFSSCWYLPSFPELVELKRNITKVNESLSKVTSTIFVSGHWYWSSSSIAGNNTSIYELNLINADNYSISRTYTSANEMSICAIIEL